MFKNALCADPDCNPVCAHRGPRGEFCHFETEKELCSILGMPWLPGITLSSLLAEVRKRLSVEAEADPSDLTVRLAERMKPDRPPQLKAVGEDD